jgi:hypothetical protein
MSREKMKRPLPSISAEMVNVTGLSLECEGLSPSRADWRNIKAKANPMTTPAPPKAHGTNHRFISVIEDGLS